MTNFPFTETLTMGTGNAKLVNTATFTIPAGKTCPGAHDCLAWVDTATGKLKDGKHQKFRCFEASMEVAFSNLHKMAVRNLAALRAARSVERMAQLIHQSLPAIRYDKVRVHVGGDFYSESYFMAWMEAARRNPDRLFYAYTKSLDTWVKFRKLVPANFILTASRGGKHDALIGKHKLREAVVVMHPDEAWAMGLEIDHDDSHARDPSVKKFALLIHGQQPAGSDAAEAIKLLKAEGVDYSYGREAKATKSESTK